MNATVVVAVAGLVATTTLGLVSPFLQGRVAARNTYAARRFDAFVDACTDAMAYANAARAHIVSFYGPDTWPEWGKHHPAPSEAITGRLDLLAPDELVEAWHAFVDAYWIVFSERMTTEMGNERVIIQHDDPLVVAALRSIDRANQALRRAVGTSR
ncbi:hypothetical protein [Dactylosporangium darangshiense]|uniref:Secreted protein n=1 Tax=Dactylosporangium darangshiense TaxID=579108 RepID=A0ABP8DMR3_9ACTN